MGQIFTFCFAPSHHGIYLNCKFKIKQVCKAFKREQTLSQFPNPNAFAQLSKPNYSWISNLSRKFQEYIFINICQRQFLAKQRNKIGDFQFGSNQIIFLKPCQTIPKIQNKILGSFNIIVRDSMNNFIIFGNT